MFFYPSIFCLLKRLETAFDVISTLSANQLKDTKRFFQFEIIINVLVTSLRFSWILIYVMGLRPL